MMRINKITDVAIRIITLPIRIGIGIVNAIDKNMPEKLTIPFEVKRKENENGTTNS